MISNQSKRHLSLSALFISLSLASQCYANDYSLKNDGIDDDDMVVTKDKYYAPPAKIINHIDLYIQKKSGDYKPICRGANVSQGGKKALVTAAHCIPPNNIPLFAKTSSGQIKALPSPLFVSNYNQLDGQDLAFFFNEVKRPSDQTVCSGNKFTVSFNDTKKQCTLTKINGTLSVSEDCAFLKGKSGSVLFDESNNACFIYSGFYQTSIQGQSTGNFGAFKRL